ncbi:hypothetical protein EDD16DRAFT_1515385 [Pisolithus croceorrhizus]|nr:hypothetical protein EDD16DRAFT_1515385 [Pisolithus croceorrhizus]
MFPGSFLFLPGPFSFHVIGLLLLRGQDIIETLGGRKCAGWPDECSVPAGFHFKTASRLKHHKSSFHNYSFHKSGLLLHSPSAGPAEGTIHNYHEKEAEMSASKINKLCYLWGCSSNGGQPPFSDHKELYKTIDATELKYNGDSKQRFENFMLGDWAWSQAQPDRMTTGQYTFKAVGNIHNNVQHAHCSGVELLTFLTIPKGSLKACMMVPWVMKCPDGHFHHIICGIGLYITDYPKQVLISGIGQNWCGRCTASPNDLDAGRPPCTVQLMRALIEELQASATWDKWGIDANIVPFTEDFPHADIWQLLVPDILHQLIKGGFKDHLMEWEWLADIDCCIATAPPFPGLWRFPDGWGFSQWTGDDSKALMKNVITEDMLSDLKMALDHFHQYHEIFQEVGMHIDGFSLPHQHSLVHYGALIHLFGAPNGLCMSIMESKHIIAVKKPWWQSSKHNALGHMLWTNQCLTQLATAHADYEVCGMLPLSHPRDSVSSQGLNDGEDKDEHAGIVDEQPILTHSDVKLAQCHAHGCARSIPALAIELGIPMLSRLIGQFLYEQLHSTATFVLPSDPSGIGSMQHEMICAILMWHHHGPA